jgi:hypothetical protein
MTGNAGFKFSYSRLSDNHTVFDGVTGQTVTLEELKRRTAEDQNRIKSKPVFDSLRESNWQNIEYKLNSLLSEDYDEDFFPPTDEIFTAVKGMLFKVNDFLGYEMTIPSFIVPDGEGGIRIEWKFNDKQLRLAISQKKHYLYFEDNGSYDGIPNFKPEQLVEKLRWLNKK